MHVAEGDTAELLHWLIGFDLFQTLAVLSDDSSATQRKYTRKISVCPRPLLSVHLPNFILFFFHVMYFCVRLALLNLFRSSLSCTLWVIDIPQPSPPLISFHITSDFRVFFLLFSLPALQHLHPFQQKSTVLCYALLLFGSDCRRQ